METLMEAPLKEYHSQIEHIGRAMAGCGVAEIIAGTTKISLIDDPCEDCDQKSISCPGLDKCGGKMNGRTGAIRDIWWKNNSKSVDCDYDTFKLVWNTAIRNAR